MDKNTTAREREKDFAAPTYPATLPRRVWIHGEETYPDYIIDPPEKGIEYGYESQIYDADPVVLARWRDVAKAYGEAQDEIREFVHSHWDKGTRIK